MRRRSYILIEVIISMMLFAVLLSVLFGIFSHFSKTNSILSRELKRHEEKTTAQLILQRIFSNIEFAKSSRPYFYIEESISASPSLVFTLQNSFNIDPAFTNTVLAKLHLEDNKLLLTMWDHPYTAPLQEPGPCHELLVLPNVSSFKIELFKAPTGKIQEHATAPEGIWTGHWPLEYNIQPTLIRITCNDDRFYFLLPRRIDPIIYKKV